MSVSLPSADRFDSSLHGLIKGKRRGSGKKKEGVGTDNTRLGVRPVGLA